MHETAQVLNGLVAMFTSTGLNVACAVIGALIYASRGKPWVGGALLGLFLGPLGVFLALVTSGGSHRPRPVPVPVSASPAPPVVPPAPRREYRMPGRCPNCNGPVHQQHSEQAWMSCAYCGAQIEGRPIS